MCGLLFDMFPAQSVSTNASPSLWNIVSKKNAFNNLKFRQELISGRLSFGCA